MERKAAIQLSLGFIVAVVFAVVLLSLSLTWLQGIFAGFTGITNDLTQQAQNKLRQTFEETNSNFAIWPNRYDLKRGEELKMSAGIKNNAEDGLSHMFVINIIPATASKSVCPGGDVNSCLAPGGKTLYEEMLTWVTWDMSSSVIQINQVGYKTISIKPDSQAKLGTYIFNVVACKDMSNYQQCTPETLNWGGASQQLAITLE